MAVDGVPGLEETDVVVEPALRSVVSSITTLRARGPRYVSLPRGTVQILIRGDGAWVTGPHVRVLRKAADAAPVIAVRIAHGAAAPLFGVSADELADRGVRLDELWRDAGDPLRELARRAREVEVDRVVAEAARALDRDPAMRVDRLGRDLGLGERQLRRRFLAAIGLTPKRYARAVRMRSALELAGRGVAWARVAVAAGYYDQAHLIGEFQAIAGTTPKAFLGELT